MTDSMDQTIDQAVVGQTPRVEVYTTRYCPYCISAKALLSRKGVPFTELDVSGDPQGRQAMMTRAQGRMTVPQIFVGATHVGGSDELHALERAGKLDPLLAAEGITLSSADQGPNR
jgi:glutaredoxin 3